VSLRGAKLIDFTGTVPGFEKHSQFDDAVVNLLRNGSENKTVVVVDRGSLMPSPQPHLVLDQINLVGTNPLCGPNHPCGERFAVVNGIYLTTVGDERVDRLPRGVVGGLKQGIVPTDTEWQKMRSLGIDFCCYNLIPTMLIAAHAGYKVVAVVVPDGVALSGEVAACLRGE
jgi:hypothetical protein